MNRDKNLPGLTQVSYQGPLPPNVLGKLTPQNIDQLIDGYVTQQKAMPDIVKLVLTQDDVRKTKRERAILAGIGLVLSAAITAFAMHKGMITDVKGMALSLFGISFGILIGKEAFDWITGKFKA
jgi:hypothetical protein